MPESEFGAKCEDCLKQAAFAVYSTSDAFLAWNAARVAANLSIEEVVAWVEANPPPPAP